MIYRNKKAGFEYNFVEKYDAGMVLLGTEIKSIREGSVSFVDSFCSFADGELWCKGLHISAYSMDKQSGYVPRRDRKLLLTKRELRKLSEKLKRTGLTIIPVSVYINDKGLAKMQIALAKGKKLYDKRQSIKERDVRRDEDRQN